MKYTTFPVGGDGIVTAPLTPPVSTLPIVWLIFIVMSTSTTLSADRIVNPVILENQRNSENAISVVQLKSRIFDC